MLWVYYKFNVASFKEAEWMKLKEKCFEYLLPYKEEALSLKERCLMDFMAYIKDHFHKTMGLHLNGLRSFTGWIKQGSYYHGLIVQQGCLHECPHLVGVPLPRWPQVTPCESCQESQMKSNAQTLSSVGLVWELRQLHQLRFLVLRLLLQRLLLKRLGC